MIPLAIPRFPLPGILAALVLDAADQSLNQTFTTLDLAGYQGYDKALDVYYLSIAYLATMRNWSNLLAFDMGRFLFYFRLIGVLLFELSHIRALLLLFPNTFEYFFVFYEAVRVRWDPRRLAAAGIIGATFAIWVFVKVPQEYWIHVAELDATDTLKRFVFGVPAATGWDTIVAENVPFLLGCAGVLAIVIAGVRRFVAPLLPPPTRRASFAADGDGSAVSPAVVDRVASGLARRLLDSDLVEKVILTTLAVVIFSRTVPGIGTTSAQLAVWVAIIVAANTAVSEWLLRHDFRWPSVVIEFAAMMGTNSVIVIAAGSELPFVGGSLQRVSTLCLLLLVTLIVMLFDRYRPIYLARRRDDARTAKGARTLWRAVVD